MQIASLLLISITLAVAAATDSECSSDNEHGAKGPSLMQIGSQQLLSKNIVEGSVQDAADMLGLLERSPKSMSLFSLNNFVESLAEKVVTEHYKMTPTETKALETIKEYVKQTAADAEKEHKEDQAEVQAAVDAISDCANDTATSLAGDVAGMKTTLQSARQEHETCRTAEGQTKDDMATACGAYDNFRKGDANRVPPECMATKLTQTYIETTDAAKKAEMESCLEAVNAWLPKLWEKYVPCKEKRSADSTKTTQCNGFQSTFESTFCSYISKLDDACDTQDTCRKHSLAAREKTNARVQGSVKNRKADYHAGQMVLCYFKIFQAKSDDDKSKMLEDCKALSVDDKHFDISFPAAPAAQACEKYPNDVCDATWSSNEYSSKAWHSKAKLASCTACPAPAPPTPAPAASS